MIEYLYFFLVEEEFKKPEETKQTEEEGTAKKAKYVIPANRGQSEFKSYDRGINLSGMN